MKKTIILLMALTMLLICVTACSGAENPASSTVQSSDDTNPPPTPTVYDLLEDLVHKEYATIEIDIVTATDFAQLSANYVLTQNNLTYRVERLNLLPLDGNTDNLSSDYKTAVSGYATVENGKVVAFDGDQNVVLPSYDELKGNFSFDEKNFKNVVIGENSFEADVVSPSQFYGADLDMSNLRVKVDYTEASLRQITVSYKTANATVQTAYVFGS